LSLKKVFFSINYYINLNVFYVDKMGNDGIVRCICINCNTKRWTTISIIKRSENKCSNCLLKFKSCNLHFKDFDFMFKDIINTIHPHFLITKKAKKYLTTLLNLFLSQLYQGIAKNFDFLCNYNIKKLGKKLLGKNMFQAALMQINTNINNKKSLTVSKSKIVSTLPFLKSTTKSIITLVALLEYIIAELIELSGNIAKKKIEVKSIQKAILNDQDLMKFADYISFDINC